MRRFDLREDQVLEVMKLVGIQPRGVVPGTFVWGILGSQVRLVLVGGELHQSMVEGANDKKAFELAQKAGLTPTEGSLQAGHVYRKKDKSLHLFLGRVKRPVADKVQFAFVTMPEVEKDLKDEEDIEAYVDEAYKRWQRKESQIYAKWNTLTWRARCQYEWVTKWATLYEERGQERAHESYPEIVFMASPKFEADVGEVEVDFFEEVRANKDLKFRYGTANAWRHDLPMQWKYGNDYDHRRYSYPNVDWRLPREEQDKIRRKFEDDRAADYRKTHGEYRDALEWVTPSK